MPARARRAALLVVALLVVAVGAAHERRPAAAGREGERAPASSGVGAPARTVRLLVTLADPPLLGLARHPRGAALPRDARGKLRLDSAPARAHLRQLDDARAAARAAIGRGLPGVRVEREYRLIANGLVVSAPAAAAADLRRLPGVRRVDRADLRRYRPLLDTSVPLIGAGALWNVEPGRAPNAGAGVKVAVVDTGIDIRNPFFNPDGFTYPAGFPRGATSFATAKVIAARVYLRPDDPVDTTRDEPTPIDHLGHGSHVAGIIAGNRNTTFDVHGTPVSVTGVAPRAQLMNYRVFYKALSGAEEAGDPELMAAFEDAITDGADVINNSWGGPEVVTAEVGADTPYALAVEAGVAVVFAAGNDGSGPYTVGWPGSHERFITVGSTNAGRQFYRTLDVTGPEPVDLALVGLRAVRAYEAPDFAQDLTGALRSAAVVDGGANPLGCAAFSAGAFAGAIAVITRGDCTFNAKIVYAAAAGAVAVVIVNDEPGDPFHMSSGTVDVPAVMISLDDGAKVNAFVAAHADATAAIRFRPRPFIIVADVDRVSGYSSTGPSSTPTLKPDVAAPGELILSASAGPVGAEATPYALLQGTSMATPHVAGAAALLKQLHPEWGHDEIKAALVATGKRDCKRPDSDDPPTPFQVGGGRLQLDRLAAVQLTFDPPVVNLGEVRVGELVERPVTLRRLDPELGRVTLRWSASTGTGAPLQIPSEGTIADFTRDAVPFTVAFGINQGDAPGEYSGWLVATTDAGVEYAAPYYFRVLPERDRNLLLVDMSFASSSGAVSPADRHAELLTAAGIEFDRAEPPENIPVPPLETLLAYRGVIVMTGNDAEYHFWPQGVAALNRLGAYLHAGGRVIVSGQGPFRGTGVQRITALLGSQTDGTPLVDDGGQLVGTGDFAVAPEGQPAFISAGLILDRYGAGDLTRVGTGTMMAVSQLGMAYPRPAFSIRPRGLFDAPFTAGVLFDPFPSYGTDPEAELTRHRAITLQFGLESAVEPEPGDPSAASPVELVTNAVRWVTEEVTLRITPGVAGYALTLDVEAASSNGAITGYRFDFGDGSPVVSGTEPTAAHTYDRFGTYPVVVLARSDLEAAAVWRQDVYVGPEADAGAAGDGGAGDGGAAPPFAATCGGCHAARPGAPAPGLLLLVVVALRTARRATRGRWERR
jgi:subtilisin family serine protease